MATPLIAPEAIVPSIPLSAKQQWRQERDHFIGGSEAYELLNQAQYGKGCWTALGFRKLGVEPDFPDQRDDDDPILKRGQILEPVVAAMYEEETGRKLRSGPSDVFTEADGTKVRLPRAEKNSDYPWAGVHVDRIILAGHGGVTETMDAEIKTRSEGPFLRVLRSGPFPGDLLQMQWANFVKRHRAGSLLVLGVFGSLPMKHFDFKRDEEVIDIFKRAGDLFAGHVWGKNEVPPPTLAPEDARCKICPWRMECRGEQTDVQLARAMKAEKASKGDLVTIENPALAELLHRRVIAKAEVASTEEDIDQLDQQIIELQGQKKAFVVGFGKSYVTPTAFHGIDQTKLKAEKPEIYQEYFVSRETGKSQIRLYPEKF